MKKWLLLAGITAMVVGLYLFANKKQVTVDTHYCAFCDPKVIEHQKFYEDSLIIALYTHRPIFPGHCLVIPKRHSEQFQQLSDVEVKQVGRIIKLVDQAVKQLFGNTAYLLLQKNGYEAGQSVPHVHFHYIPRMPGDSSALKFIAKMYIANIGPPIKDELMQQNVRKLHNAMLSLTQSTTANQNRDGNR